MNKKGVTFRQLLPAIIFIVVLLVVLLVFLRGTSYGSPFDKVIKALGLGGEDLDLGLDKEDKITIEGKEYSKLEASKKAGEDLELAKKYHEEGKYDDAIDYAEKVIRNKASGLLEWQQAETIVQLSSEVGGDIHFKNKEWNKAISYYNDAIASYKRLERLDEKEAYRMHYVYYVRANAYMTLGKISYAHYDFKRVEQSKYENLKKKLEEKFSKIDCYWLMARTSYKDIDEKEDYGGALAGFMDIIENWSDTICVEDAKEKVYLICSLDYPLNIRNKLKDYQKKWCEKADGEPEKYYPESKPKT